MFKATVENLTTTAKIAGQVMRGRAFVETLVPRNRNHVYGTITRCTCTDEEKARPDFHANAEDELDRVCPKGLAKGEFVEGWNSRVDAGASWQAAVMGSAAGTPALYVALTAAALSPAHTDTTLASEITSNGCGRAAGTYAYGTAPVSLGAAGSYSITKLFTATGSQSVTGVALFNAVSTGTLFVEALLGTSASLASGDTLNVVYTINI